MSVLVYTEAANGRIAKAGFEATYYGSKVAEMTGTHCVVLCHGDASPDALGLLGNYGAKKVLSFKQALDTVSSANLTASAAKQENADVVILAADFTGKAIGGALAVKLNAGFVSGACALPVLSNGFVVKRSVFSGKAFADCKVNTSNKVISLLPNSIPVQTSGATAEVSEFATDLAPSKLIVKEIKKKGGEGVPLPEADIVISGGRGLKGPENWGMVETLAKEMGAATACSRPVSDIGWRPHHEHVGQTGLAVRPNLYIAIGISGAIQHLAGVNQSKVMVVINTDAEAPFFKAANYGIVGDAFNVVPKLIDAFKKFKASHN